MPKPTSPLKVPGYFGAGLMLLFFLYVISDMFSPLYQGLQLSFGGASGKSLRREEICSSLLRGDYDAASAPIARKTDAREFRFADTITWLAGKGGEPFVKIPRSQLFSELPSDQGPLQSYRGQASATFSGDSIVTSLYLGYPGSRVTVSMRYITGWFSPTLERIRIGAPEPTGPATPPPDETDLRMSELIKKLDRKD